MGEISDEDMEFARRTEEAYKRHGGGEFKMLSADKFIEELDELFDFYHKDKQ